MAVNLDRLKPGRTYARDRIVLTPQEYIVVGKSVAPLRASIERALATLLSPDGLSARDYASWSGIPGSDDFCLVDFCGNATVILPQETREDAGRELRAVEATYIPGWFLQSVLRTIVDASKGPVPKLPPLFAGHDPLGTAKVLERSWIDMPVDFGDPGFLQSPEFPKPVRMTLTERPWCAYARGFKPYSLHTVASSWVGALKKNGEIDNLVWSRPRLSLVALTGVDMVPERLGGKAAGIYGPLFDVVLNSRFKKEHRNTISHQTVRLGFNRVRKPDAVPQGWRNSPPDFGRAHPVDFLPPKLNGAGTADRSERFELPPELVEGTGGQEEEDDVLLEDTYEPAGLPEATETEAGEPDIGLEPDTDPDDDIEDAPSPENEGGTDAPLAGPASVQEAPARSQPADLAGLYVRPAERHLEFCLSFTTTTGELFGFYSKKGIEYAAGADMNGLLAFIHKLNPMLAAMAEKNVGSFLELDPANFLFADLMILEPLLLDVSFADPKDGDCHFEISVELLKEGGWFRHNVPQKGQIDPVPEPLDENGTDVELERPPPPDGDAGPRLEDLPDDQPFYRVRIRHTGELSIGLRQPLSNLLGRGMPGFIELYVEKMAHREEFRALPYERWRATKPKKAHRKDPYGLDIHTHEHSPGLFLDTLNELVETASLGGGFTPAVAVFDAIDVLHLATYLTSREYNLIRYGDSAGYTAFGQRVEGTLQPAMMLLAAAPVLSKGKLKAGFQIVGATGAFGMLGWTAWDAAANAPVATAATAELAKRFGGYARMSDNEVLMPDPKAAK